MPVGTNPDNYGFIFFSIDRTIGVENIQRFREDLKEIVLEKMDKFHRWGENTKKLKREGLEAAQRARETKWDKVGFLLGLVGAFTFFLPIIPTVASFAGVLLSIVTGIRRAAVEILLYENPYELRSRDNVKFACAWNRAMDGWTSLLVCPLGILAVLAPQGYRIGLWIIADEIDRKYNS
jgi:hypothetical protein